MHQSFYHQLIVKPSSHFELFVDFLDDLLSFGFEESEDTIIIRSEDDLETVVWGIEQFAEALQRATAISIDVDLELTKEKNSDWVKEYQNSIEPVEVGDFYIHTTWQEPKSDKIDITLDPALAFGTGHHPTTASCLMAISDYVKSSDRVLDVGCGSGILSIAAIKKSAVVDACDTDEVSVENSIKNAALNSVEYNRIWQGSIADSDGNYDVIVANIVADVLIFISSNIKQKLKKDGTIILSGIMDKYADRVLKSYKDFTLLERYQKDEWVTLVMKGNG